MTVFLGGGGDGFLRARRTGVETPTDAGRFLYLCLRDDDVDAPGNGNGDKELARLLQAEVCACDFCADGSSDVFLILPRPGRISAWGAKAGEILRRCGFAGARRIERGLLLRGNNAGETARALADAMCETVFDGKSEEWKNIFAPAATTTRALSSPLQKYDEEKIRRDCKNCGLGAEETEHLLRFCARQKRAPSDAELMMFAQVNSEHCRHHFFNAEWKDGGETLMRLIRKTHENNPRGTITAFSDNAAIVCGAGGGDFFADAKSGVWRAREGAQCVVAKAETHNHPTAIAPFAGAATGSGGEIRDEAAAGRGASARAGFCAYAVSSLPLAQCPPALHPPPPPRFANAMRIITEAPLGAAAYNNEFGRPCLAGFFRAMETVVCRNTNNGGEKNIRYGFHKPLMLAGGLGHILPEGANKLALSPGDFVVHLGGPGLRVGMGGGAASSGAGGARKAEDDFQSVQRDNAEMQRRAQEVIDAARRMPECGGVLAVHDVGAGGLGNAIAELAHFSERGAHIKLAHIPIEESSLSAAEIWCNEAQERYVLALAPNALPMFAEMCARERCPFAVIGEITEKQSVTVVCKSGETVVDFPLEELLGKIPRKPRKTPPVFSPSPQLPKKKMRTVTDAESLRRACYALLRHPTVASKQFLITIGDRTVGGLTARDQMVGPWQTPVADCAAFFDNFADFSGACFALGERAGIAAHNPEAGARMAIAEALCNLAAANADLDSVKLSLNWLADSESGGGDLRAAVHAASEFCISAGIAVVVGKDSLSMRMPAGMENDFVCSPAFAAAAAFAPLADARAVLTPQFSGGEETVLMLLSPGEKTGEEKHALGGSVFSSFASGAAEEETPDVSGKQMRDFWNALADCKKENLLLAYHDCGDGGLWAAVCEMAFASNGGAELIADALCAPAGETDGDDAGKDALSPGGWEETARALFCENAAALAEVHKNKAARVLDLFAARGLQNCAIAIGIPSAERKIRIYRAGKTLLEENTADLRSAWGEAGAAICERRDNPQCAREEANRDYENDSGLFVCAPKNWRPDFPAFLSRKKPRVAILREQGTNGQREMAAAFSCAGFEAEDVHLSDLQNGRRRLDDFCGAAFCGGFSFGDVLGAGRGFAGVILRDKKMADMFRKFFARDDVFVLGICNGCQTLSLLGDLMPGGGEWRFPLFLPNRSGVFEARLAMAEVLPNRSPLFAGMEGMFLPVVSSHAEGRAVFYNNGGDGNIGGGNGDNNGAMQNAPAVMRFVDNTGAASEAHPHNPNGSEGGLCGFTSPDGRIAALMPHPERAFRAAQMSWFPKDWHCDHTPWLQIFTNARRFADS